MNKDRALTLFVMFHWDASEICFFFFSSRRRHTRFDCDWSSDVCSSDLDLMLAGDLVIDQANYSVAVGSRTLELTFKEYELLRFLVTHRGRVFTREALLKIGRAHV